LALWPDDDDISVDLEHIEKIWNDPHYGLRDPENVEQWGEALCSQDKDIMHTFQNEIMTYFQIRHKDQMHDLTQNFCSIVEGTKNFVISACPKARGERCDVSDFSYWQWASSYFTQLDALDLQGRKKG